ncbi:hypothetical protein [Parvularcula maris]|uniref:glutamine synthetase n=1 Tax=Parvularcula maris TaxID=2965077 RepID=A0A9X2RKZ0_9PROT|nr:hypothetical protein [Parvularcula maris]MCQ8186062.1 hypothetical protein [Parvularcula maris]
MVFAEYIWIDGDPENTRLQSKMRVLDSAPDEAVPSGFPTWSFDATSTRQGGVHAECLLVPVCVARDPFREDGYLVLCEVLCPGRLPHQTNTRAKLQALAEGSLKREGHRVGYEQDYTLFQDGRPLGFPCIGAPDPDAGYYCGVGSERAFGRQVAEEHAQRCVAAGLLFAGYQAERMPGQWEFRIDAHERGGEEDVLSVADHLWLARWILERVGENHGIGVCFAQRPMKGGWADASLDVTFSTAAMRCPSQGLGAITDAATLLEAASLADGAGLEISVPVTVAQKGYGHLRALHGSPKADPYTVARRFVAALEPEAEQPEPAAELVA